MTHAFKRPRAHAPSLTRPRTTRSWQADPGAKWDELVDWCDEFKRQHGRWPLLWIDRFCVGSHDVPMSIACLPVFVSSCNTMLVLFDETFLSRLWCIVELWCFLAVRSRRAQRARRGVSTAWHAHPPGACATGRRTVRRWAAIRRAS